MNQSQVMMQSCAITARGGPRCLTFAPRRLKTLTFSIQIICCTLWISQVQSSGFPSIFLRAQPQPTFYLISNVSGASNFAGFLPVHDKILATFFLASSSLIQPPERVFQDSNGYWSILLTAFLFFFFFKFNAPISRFRGPPILLDFHPGKKCQKQSKKTDKKRKTPRCMWPSGEHLKPTDLEIRGSSLARRVVSLTTNFTPLCFSSPRCING